jgi:hypothetical protein
MARTRHRKVVAAVGALFALLAIPHAEVHAAEADAKKEDDGTDPTKLTRSASIAFEHLDLVSGFQSDQFTLTYNEPIGVGATALQIKVPYSSVDFLGDTGFGLGDISLKLTRVMTVNRSYGMVVNGELILDTAGRSELGAGQYILKPGFIYAMFLPDGSILAPSIFHSVSFGGDDLRRRVNLTVVDFYYVPKLSNKALFMTLDPAVSYGWTEDAIFGSLAVTVGYKLGPMLGGNAQISLKPSFTFGGDRPSDWGVQITFKVLGF